MYYKSQLFIFEEKQLHYFLQRYEYEEKVEMFPETFLQNFLLLGPNTTDSVHKHLNTVSKMQ